MFCFDRFDSPRELLGLFLEMEEFTQYLSLFGRGLCDDELREVRTLFEETPYLLQQLRRCSNLELVSADPGGNE